MSTPCFQVATPVAQQAASLPPASCSCYYPTPVTHSLQGMALLTGPNMAGKSTILRSVCAVALLGACGLYAPAGSARVPYFGAPGESNGIVG